MYILTVIEIQGHEEEVFEVYADNSPTKTVGFVFEEKDAKLIELIYELRNKV